MNHNLSNRLTLLAVLAGLIGVVFGAFGAHFLKSRIPVESLEVIRTGVLYLFIHTLATLVCILFSRQVNSPRWLLTAGSFFMLGVLLFSGSLFLIGTSSLTGLHTNYIGFLTPLGGLSFITGWLIFGVWAVKYGSIH